MFNKLIKLAYICDLKGHYKTANYITKIIKKAAEFKKTDMKKPIEEQLRNIEDIIAADDDTLEPVIDDESEDIDPNNSVEIKNILPSTLSPAEKIKTPQTFKQPTRSNLQNIITYMPEDITLSNGHVIKEGTPCILAITHEQRNTLKKYYESQGDPAAQRVIQILETMDEKENDPRVGIQCYYHGGIGIVGPYLRTKVEKEKEHPESTRENAAAFTMTDETRQQIEENARRQINRALSNDRKRARFKGDYLPINPDRVSLKTAIDLVVNLALESYYQKGANLLSIVKSVRDIEKGHSDNRRQRYDETQLRAFRKKFHDLLNPRNPHYKDKIEPRLVEYMTEISEELFKTADKIGLSTDDLAEMSAAEVGLYGIPPKNNPKGKKEGGIATYPFVDSIFNIKAMGQPHRERIDKNIKDKLTELATQVVKKLIDKKVISIEQSEMLEKDIVSNALLGTVPNLNIPSSVEISPQNIDISSLDVPPEQQAIINRVLKHSNICKKLIRIAENLDKCNRYKDADYITNILGQLPPLKGRR